ncbi:hypothetical protein SAMN05446935_9815 [Burkholderia sp. YR290]|nr:hypothetical protein SAMN05446935_9815 [Burkholderia sp. YR290]
MVNFAQVRNSERKWVLATLIIVLLVAGGFVVVFGYNKPQQPANQPSTPTTPVGQRTLGPQSPAVSNVTGNVSIIIGEPSNKTPELKTPEFKTTVKTPEDVKKLTAFLKAHAATVVSIKLTFPDKSEGGVSDFDHEKWMDWVGEDVNTKKAQPLDITFDRESQPEGGSVEDHLILRINNTGHFVFIRNPDGYGLKLEGNFMAVWTGEVGQGYDVASLTPEN